MQPRREEMVWSAWALSDILEEVEEVTKGCPSQAPEFIMEEEETVGDSFPASAPYIRPHVAKCPQLPLWLGSKVCRLLHFAFCSQPFWCWGYCPWRVEVWTFVSNPQLTYRCWHCWVLYIRTGDLFFLPSVSPVCTLKWSWQSDRTLFGLTLSINLAF